MKRKALKAAFPHTIPIFTGFFFLGAAYGIYMSTSGFSFVYPMLMSLLIFGGSLEFVAVEMLQKSGAIELVCKMAEPLADFFNFPKEIVPMAVLRPVSGSGATALLTNIFENYGPDSFPGQIASVLAGSSETTIYAVTMYFGSVGITKTRHTLWVGLLADLTALVMSIVTVKFVL